MTPIRKPSTTTITTSSIGPSVRHVITNPLRLRAARLVRLAVCPIVIQLDDLVIVRDRVVEVAFG